MGYCRCKTGTTLTTLQTFKSSYYKLQSRLELSELFLCLPYSTNTPKQDPTTGQDNVAINNIRYNETTGNQDNGKNVGDYVTYVLECLGLCIPLLILLSSWT
jgi:hypothetical protein